MRHLIRFNESKHNNEVYYIISDIMQEFLDDNSIKPLPDLEDISGDFQDERADSTYEDYLSDPGPMSYGYLLKNATNSFYAANGPIDDEIDSFALWNIDKERYKKLVEYVESQQDRIREATGFYPKLNVQDIDNFKVDVYIEVISNEEYLRNRDTSKITSYINKINSKSNHILGLPHEKRQQVFDLLDKVFDIIK